MAVRSRRSAHKRKQRSEGRLPRNAAPISLTISHIGGRGDGVGSVRYTHNYAEAEYSVFVPASLPGETIIAQPLSISKQGKSPPWSDMPHLWQNLQGCMTPWRLMRYAIVRSAGIARWHRFAAGPV